MTRNLCLLIIKTDVTLTSEALAPEALDGGDVLAVGQQEPEAENGLGQDIEDGIGDDLSVDRPLASTISNTPDNWIQSPEDEGEAANGSEEGGGGIALAGDGTASTDSEDVDDEEVCGAGDGVPSPLAVLLSGKGSEKTGEDHDNIGDNGNQDISSGEACQERQIEEEERGGNSPVNVASKVDLAVDLLNCVWGVLMNLGDDEVCEGNTVAGSHGVVGEGGEDGDQGGDNVEQALLLLANGSQPMN